MIVAHCATHNDIFCETIYKCYGTYMIQSNRSYKTILEHKNSSYIVCVNGIFRELQEGILQANIWSILAEDMLYYQIVKYFP